MLGERGPQAGLFAADTMYLKHVGQTTFYGFLAAQRGTIFRDEDFAGLYCLTNGRPSVPPSLLAIALVLQTYDGVSDDEAKRRADYDLQWKVALGVELDARPFAKSTLQEFRAQLVIHDEQQAIFRKSLELAKQQGHFKGQRKLKVALDTTNILGRGAVKDAYNLLADGIVLVLRVLAKQAGEKLAIWAQRESWGRYVSTVSVKGQAEIDWSDAGARRGLLQTIVADADRLLERVRTARGLLEANSPEDAALAEAAGLLARVLAQNIERTEAGPAVHQGVAEDRMPAVQDPEVRHGRKSSAKKFNGHKTQVVVDTDSQLITAVAVIPGNAPDSEQALEVVEATEANTGCPVEATIGDCAYGDGDTRQEFDDAQRTLVAKVPTMTNQGCFPKTDFTLDLDTMTCTCPAGHTTETFRPAKTGGGVFHFADAVCGACPLREQCARGKAGRSVAVHPQERLLQAARAFQASPAFREYRTRRQVVEHRIARLIQLGLRQARYVGRAKTLFQVAMAAAVANLTLLMHRADADPSSGLLTPVLRGIIGLLIALQSRRDGFRMFSPVFASVRKPVGAPRLQLPLRPPSPSPTWPSRPHF